MKSKHRLLRLNLIFCLVLGWAFYVPTASPHIALADNPPPPGEALEYFAPVAPPTPPPPSQEEMELHAALAALELAHQQGPEAVLALGQTLHGKALDLAMADIVEAQRQLAQRATPHPETAPISEAEELAMLQAQAASDAAGRARALAHLAEPFAPQAPDVAPDAPMARNAPNAPSADLTVGSAPCTYATIGAAMLAANNGDRLLLEGGRVFTGSLTVHKSLTFQGGYSGCGSGSSDLTTIDAGGSGRALYIYDNLTVTLQNLNVTNADTTAYGAGIFVYTNTQLIGTNLNIYSNTSTALGGGVFLWGARATFSETEIFSNTAAVGAGVYGAVRGSYAPELNLASYADVHNNRALTGNGFGGGVYMNQGTVIVTNSSDIYANNATEGGGAYLISSTLTIEGEYSEIADNTATGDGGGIHALGSTINLDRDAEVFRNTAGTDGTGNGGGVYLDNSDLWSDKGLIYYNTANGNGGGVYATNGSLLDMDLSSSYPCVGPRCSQLSYNTATGNGGGVWAANSEVDLVQIFIEGNSSALGGGIYAWRDPSVSLRALYLYNCLLARNNGGAADGIRLYTSAGQTTRMAGSHNTLAYNPSAGNGVAIAMNNAGTLGLSLVNSIIWGHTTSINTAGQTVTYSDIQGGYAGTGNLDIDPLFVNSAASNFHLLYNSPVIDQCATGESRDFDNEPRPITYVRPATPYDMGADEAAPRVGINGATCAYGSIQDAVDAANPGDVIQAAADTFIESVDIAKTLTLIGGYDVDCTTYITGTTIVDGSGSSGSVFDITANVVTLRNLQITGGNAVGGGVDADSGAHVTLDNTRVSGNTGTYGAGLYVGTTAVMTLTNGTRIENNTATAAGGGARVWGKLVITSWVGGITENTAPHGGGVSVPEGVLEMRPGHVGNNQATAADGRGGGIHVLDGGVITATESSNVYRNSAYDGGGIYADNARVTLGAVIHSNTAANNGGGIYLNDSALDANGTIVGDDVAGRSNVATAGAGGGIYAQNSAIKFEGTIHNNAAATRGGGIAALSGVITLTNAHVGGVAAHQANRVTDEVFGAGLYVSDTHALLSNTVVASNTFSSGAGWGGGIVAWDGSVVTLTEGSRVENHYAPNVGWFGGGGAGILLNNSTATLSNSQVLSNTADLAGAGVQMVQTSTLNILGGSVIAYNRVITGNGGGIAASNVPDINLSDSTLYSNTASTHGGAIYLDAGTLDFTGWWDVRDNVAGGNGGAVAVTGTGDVDFRATGAGSSILYNQAGGDGGALYIHNADTVQLHSTSGYLLSIGGNQAGGNGGAAFGNGANDFDVYGQVIVTANSAGGNGGAFYLTGGSGIWLDDYANLAPEVRENWAQNGGAIYAQDSPKVWCHGATFGYETTGNQATAGAGGALYLSGSTFNAENCTLRNNQATGNGGAIAAYTSTLNIKANYSAIILAAERADGHAPLAPQEAAPCNPLVRECSSFSGNIADSYGGALYINNGTLHMDHTYVHRNVAERGGAIHLEGGSPTAWISNTLIYSNTATSGVGAGVRMWNGSMTATHSTFAHNTGSALAKADGTVYIFNSLAWGNTAGFVGTYDASSNCNIDQEGNVGTNVDPQFIAPGAGEDYHLKGNSPAIDACATGLPLDLDNKARPIGDLFDMGAYEGSGEIYIYLPLVLRNHTN